MRVTHLRLRQFRNYSEEGLALRSGLHVFEGRNAQGKTALLEAIYLGATARSFRTHRDLELIGWDQSEAEIELQLERDSGRSRQLRLHWKRLEQQCRREIQLQGNPVRKLADFLAELPLALFTPDDLELVQGGPQQRRAYLDLLLCKLYPTYLEDLGRYQKALKQKNALLKTGLHADQAQLESWDQILARTGSEVTRERQTLCQRLAPILRQTYQQLSGESSPLELTFQPSNANLAEEFYLRLLRKRPEEIRLRTSLLGPHRDELLFHLGPGEVRRFGSQGQRRTLALALRLAQADILRDLGRESPVVLLDDCFSELDPQRQARLLEWLSDCGQVLITTATPLELHQEHLHFRVEQGQVRPC